MLNSAGALMALDERTSFNSSLGGILQSSNYIGALSGSSWLLGSLIFQNWSSVESILNNPQLDLWNLTTTRQLVNQDGLWTILFPVLFENLDSALSHLNFWDNGDKTGIKYDLQNKTKADNDDYASDKTWSDIRNIDAFANHEMPFPLITALGRKPGTVVYNLNSTVVEMNPFEIGSFDPSLNTFMDIEYIGTNVSNGTPTGVCINGFDNAGFVMGTSSSLFNQFLNTLVCDDCNSLNFVLKWVLKQFLTRLSSNHEDVALYKPNPFYNSQYANSNNITTSDTLYLIDGGIGGEIIPLSTLITTDRKLDAVFAFDSSDDLDIMWPNGTALVNSYERQFSNQGSSMVCPYIPDQNTFLNQNLTAKPTFFGCDAKNLTDLTKDGVVPPIIIYFANRPYEFYSNTSTYALTFTNDEKLGMIQNGYDIATRLNSTIDENFKTCIACALIQREEERRGIEQSDQCKECFKDYCWDGTIATNEPLNLVNFTDSGLTNGSTTFYGDANDKYQSSGLSLFKREETEDVEVSISNTGGKMLPSMISIILMIVSSMII
ncbi:unnamed protein product [Candida verbasci]|uniref:Lysophospholipase n=1 Tax=Candida verbasci TaxID=1227364 RepID=A0A9W4TSR3_9ASCO|nr:unnamed protein product [Candida verbasci]